MSGSKKITPGLYLVALLFQATESAENCIKSSSGPSIAAATAYTEAVLGTDVLLSCRVCPGAGAGAQHQGAGGVTWRRGTAPVAQSSRVHSLHTAREAADPEAGLLVSLRIRAVTRADLGNYSCSLGGGGASLVLDTLPPPPVFTAKKDGINQTSQLLSWTGSSQLPIIHFLMEFRLRPVAGLGEDWVSLVIPHRQGAELQTYLLQGLTPGTSYEARLRTRTRHGTSHYSDTWQFRTWSPWTPAPPPVTLVSLPRTQDTAGHGDTQQHRTSNKDLSPFSSGSLNLYRSSGWMGLVVVGLLMVIRM